MITKRYFLNQDYTINYYRPGGSRQKVVPAGTELDISGGDDEGVLCYQVGDTEGVWPMKLSHSLIHCKVYETKLIEEGPFVPPSGLFLTVVTEENC